MVTYRTLMLACTAEDSRAGLSVMMLCLFQAPLSTTLLSYIERRVCFIHKSQACFCCFKIGSFYIALMVIELFVDQARLLSVHHYLMLGIKACTFTPKLSV